ncbi:AbrB/MazE/SpoVT family DNA-binding domain-containing protein [Thermococcus sibiricus]|uniref:Predicted transcription regulator, SpoVT/AbrB family n=1 Tax=Thermococcus sibiricus (strain DSM 12597 / MM 739) TaxID=604354 RepID=C6A0C1_THESM|nr:AbrB/MazE/SpoVT family DNA-binding domain-containing protein [Thermococcus sibiricus]ACS91102.1 Predicted transcription regulator, SpoVT/AbrB family [Thermococcus sibiricus MM 739]
MEVLAKFHVVVHKIGRIIIPAGTRKFYGINEGDFVEVKIIKYENNEKAREGTFTARVGEQGALVIPKALREVMNIKPGDVLEVLLLAHYKADKPKRND